LAQELLVKNLPVVPKSWEVKRNSPRKIPVKCPPGFFLKGNEIKRAQEELKGIGGN